MLHLEHQANPMQSRLFGGTAEQPVTSEKGWEGHPEARSSGILHWIVPLLPESLSFHSEWFEDESQELLSPELARLALDILYTDHHDSLLQS